MKVCKQTNAEDSDSVWSRLSTGNPRNICLLHLSSIKITIWPGRDQKNTIHGARGALSILFPWNLFTQFFYNCSIGLGWEIFNHFLCDIACMSSRVDCWSACFPFFGKFVDRLVFLESLLPKRRVTQVGESGKGCVADKSPHKEVDKKPNKHKTSTFSLFRSLSSQTCLCSTRTIFSEAESSCWWRLTKPIHSIGISVFHWIHAASTGPCWLSLA